MNKILRGDCIEVMKAIKPNSIDAIVTDPPYGLEFMGKKWDRLIDKRPAYNEKIAKHKDNGRHGGGNNPYVQSRVTYNAGLQAQLWHAQWLTEAHRVLKPGASMLVMGGTRTFHRLMVAIEDSGFIIKDTLMWLYGSGFPKAQDLGKMIDKRNGDGKGWHGFKVGGIKPAYEPIVWAVKPPEGSCLDNVLKWGVGAVNVDECRVGIKDEDLTRNCQGLASAENEGWKRPWHKDAKKQVFGNNKGRFPANIILDEEAGKMLDEQSGASNSYRERNAGVSTPGENRLFNYIGNKRGREFPDNGGASRFFYCAKASRGERNAGLEGMEEKRRTVRWKSAEGDNWNNIEMTTTNSHPTVKPIALFEYLIKLVTRKGQIILDPFLGSGTTAIAAHKVERECVGIEREEEYIEIAKKRVEYWQAQPRNIQGVL